MVKEESKRKYELSDEGRKNIQEAAKGNLRALKDGRQSVQVQRQAGTHCGDCPLFDRCPVKVAEGDSICAIGEFLEFAHQIGRYEFPDVLNYLRMLLSINTTRYSRAVLQELEDDAGLDPETTKLSTVLDGQFQKLMRLEGHDRVDPQVLIDKRRQILQVNVDSLSSEEHKAALQFLARVRAEKPELAERMLSSSQVELIGEVVQDEDTD